MPGAPALDLDTVAVYDREAERYADWSARQGLPRHFHRYAARLVPGGRVLDLGCGGGWAARAFAERGFPVTAVDPSGAMIARLSDLPGIEAIVGDVFALPATARFAGIWAHFSLQHVPRAAFGDVIARVAGLLQAGGWLFLGLHEGGGERRDGLGRFYVHHDADGLRQTLAGVGLGVARLARHRSTGYDGSPIRVLHLEAGTNG